MRIIVCLLGMIFFFQKISAQNDLDLINSANTIVQGISLSDSGDHKSAIKLFLEVSRSDTNYSIALHELSYAYYQDSNYDNSLYYANKGLKLFPEKANDWYSLSANVLDAENKYQEAVDYYDRSLKLNPYNYYTWFNKGLAFYNDKSKGFRLLPFTGLIPSTTITLLCLA